MVAGQLHIFPGGRPGLGAGIAAVFGKQGQARAGRLSPIQVFAAEHAKSQGRISQQPHFFPVADFRQPHLETAVEQAVGVLYALDAGQAPGLFQAEAVHDAPGGFVGDPHLANLARPHQVGQHPQGVFQGNAVVFLRPGIAQLAEKVGLPVRPVQLVIINVIRLQAA